MKKLFITMPAIVFVIAACTSRPVPSTHWRVGSLSNHGNRIVLMPLDVRVHTKGANTAKKNKLWEKSMNSGYALMRYLPNYLESRNYSVTHQIMWSGIGVDQKGVESPLLREQQVARAFLSMSGFAGNMNDVPLKHTISPDVFKSLATTSDLTLYSAQWTNYKQTTDGGKIFLKTLGIILIVAIAAVIIVAVVAGSGKGGGGGGGGIFSGIGKLFGAGAKGVARSSGAIAKAVARTAGRVVVNTARVAARVNWQININGGYTNIDIPESSLEPVYAESELSKDPETCNRYLGVYEGISPLKPVFKAAGMFYAFVLVDNKSGQIVWDSKIFIPQGADTKGLNQKIKEVFNSLPSFNRSTDPNVLK